MAYSQDLRIRVIAYVEGGHTQLEAAGAFQVHHKTVSNWLRLKALTGSLKPRPFGGGAKPRVTKEELKTYVNAHPDAILADMAQHFDLTIPGIAYHLHKHGYVQKKSKIC